MLTSLEKKRIIDSVKEKLSTFSEVQKIVLFGSFLEKDEPNDLDIAIMQRSNENYLSLSLKYRKVLRDIAKKIPLDIIPIDINKKGFFTKEIEKGKVIYER